MSEIRRNKDPVKTIRHDVYPSIDPRTTFKNSQQGKVVLITGASQGIGKAIALAFAHAGVKGLSLSSRSIMSIASELEKELKEIQPNIQLVFMDIDVRKQENIENLFQITKERLGTIDILVNNAGMIEDISKKIHESNVDEYWNCYEINIKGTYLATREFLKQEGGKGTIINTSSIGSLIVLPGASGYQSGKTAINRFTEFVYEEYKDKGIRAFAYHPGGIKTTLATKMPEKYHHLLVDTAELAAGFCLYLASPKADYLNGRYVSANWDVDELEEMKEEILANDKFKMVLS